MALNDALNLAAQYGNRGLDIQPMPQQMPQYNFQMPPVQAPQRNGMLQQGVQALGTKLLGKYLNKPKPTSAPDDVLLPQTARSVDAPQLINSGSGLHPFSSVDALPLVPLAKYAAGGNWSQYLGLPVEVGENGPEPVIDDQGNQSVVGQNGPQTVIPTRPATVIPNPGPSSQVLSAGSSAIPPPPDTGLPPLVPSQVGYSGDTSGSRPRVSNMRDFIANKIQDEKTGVTGGPVWGSGQTSVDADGNVIKAPGRLHAALAGLLAGAQAGFQGTGNWRGALGGAATGAVTGGVKPEYGQLMSQGIQAQRDQGTLNQIDQNQAARLQEGLRQAQITGTLSNAGVKRDQLDINRDRAQTAKLAVTNRAAIEAAKNTLGINKLSYTEQRDTANRVAKMFNDSPEFDPEDPKNANIVAAAEELDIPLFKKTRAEQSQLVLDTATGGYTKINKNTGIATPIVTGPDNKQFTVTPPHQIRLDEIEARANAAAANAKTARDAKTLANQSRSQSWSDAADEYERQAKEAESNGSIRSATQIRLKATAARQKALQYKTGQASPVVVQ